MQHGGYCCICFENLRQFFAPVRLRGAQSDDPEYHAAERARQRSVQKNRTCDREYLGADAKDQTFCLCQDRTHNFFAFLEFYDSVQR